MAFLELTNVSKGYGFGAKRAEVLRGINLSIAEGEFVAIVGYSGAGKTTLMSLMAGLQSPDEGRITLRGEAVKEPSPDRAIVFQNYSLLPWLSVYENIALAVDEVFAAWPAAKRRECVEKHIAMVNLTPARDKKPRELSGGMRQRVSVARALAMDPKILLLDEPLSALDAITRATLQDEIGRIWSEAKKTVVLITNDVDEGILLADRIIPLSAGPDATLGPEVKVEIERPRDRTALNHDPRFKQIRRDIIGYLLGPGGKPKVSSTRKLVLPDIEPEQLNRPPPLFAVGRPRRRSEERRETVELP
jgi:nitrate/nitrite transport system ATP-binding protein